MQEREVHNLILVHTQHLSLLRHALLLLYCCFTAVQVLILAYMQHLSLLRRSAQNALKSAGSSGRYSVYLLY
jgi:hypothetical protein